MSLLLFSLAITPASAFVQSDLDTLSNIKDFPKCDLSGAKLYDKDLSGAKLYGANFTDAKTKGSTGLE